MNLKIASSSTQRTKDSASVDKQKISAVEYIKKSKKQTHDDEYYKINITVFKRCFSKLQRNYLSDKQDQKNK